MPKNPEKPPVRVTRRNKVVEEVVNNEEIEDSENKLSNFKLDSKKKLKRQHLTVAYEGEDVAKNKTEANIENDENEESKDKSKTTTKRMKFNSENKPPNWEEVVNNLREMRKRFDAPVDSMGCDRCPDETADPKDQRYQSLLSLMLSSRTKDEVTFAAMDRLKKHKCTVDSILNTSDEKLAELISPVAFWRNKAKFIKKATQVLRDQYDDDIPRTVEELCKLPGVGPKMAHLCMNTAWGELTGIGVDTHVHRISNRLGWANTNDPEDTRKVLEEWMPKELWKELNHLLVGFGQQICKANKPQCENCLNRNICPFGKKILKGKK